MDDLLMNRTLPRKVPLLLLILILLTSGACSMAEGSRTKPCLFSPISGTITLNGEPVNKAQLIRTVDRAHTSGQLTDTATTNEAGEFEMSGVFDKVLLGRILPMEFVAPQKIVVEYQGQSYEMWNGIKRSREVNAESSGRPLVVTCELTSAIKQVSVGGGFVNSLCTWDFEPDPEIDFSKIPAPGTRA